MINSCNFYYLNNSLKIFNCYKHNFNGIRLLVAYNNNLVPKNSIRPFSKQSTKLSQVYAKESFFKKIVKKIPFLDISKNKLQYTSYLLYETVADKLNYDDFFKVYNIPDTFYSWFAITELHVWMLSVRAMAEGEDGRFIRNNMVQAMWTDVSQRAKKLGAANPSGVRKQITELHEQFNAALIAYDEGLLSSDPDLAGALWRKFFQYKCDNPQHLESLVIYVRKQIRMLEKLSYKEFVEERKIKWLPLEPIR